MRFLILAHSGDATAALVAARLRQLHSPKETRLVLLDKLISCGWAHRVNSRQAGTLLTFPDGSTVEDGGVGVVLNRLRYVDMPQFAGASQVDREYALMEMFALLVSFLKSLRCPVFNPLSPQNLGGEIHSWIGWHRLAEKAGLPVARIRVTNSLRRYSVPGLFSHADRPAVFGNTPAVLTDESAEGHLSGLVAGPIVLGDIPAALAQGCVRLAALSGLAILQVHFALTENGRAWKFNGVDVCPQLESELAVSAIVRLLEQAT